MSHTPEESEPAVEVEEGDVAENPTKPREAGDEGSSSAAGSPAGDSAPDS
jgi:hypothetical protein